MFGDRVDIIVDDVDKDYILLEKLLKENSIEIYDNRVVTPSLENVFIHLIQQTG
jgi:hypothetical protein